MAPRLAVKLAKKSAFLADPQNQRFLVDDDLHIAVQNIPPSSTDRRAQITCCVQDMKDRWFQSHIVIRVPSNARTLCLANVEAISGSYTGWFRIWLDVIDFLDVQ